MINFVQETNKKKCSVFSDDTKIIDLQLIPSSITNKFNVVTSFINGMSKHYGNQFDEWFINLINTYTLIDTNQIDLNNISEYDIDKPTRFTILESNSESLIKFVNGYIDSLQIDFSNFVDEKKAKKNSILFRENEIKIITRLSGYLKVYSLFFNSENLRLDDRMHRVFYNILSKEITNTEIINKIFNIIQTRTFRYNISDKYMWDYIKMVQCKSIDIHVIEIFNFIMNSILVLCESDKNPIIYFIGVVEESVKWFLRSVYKGSIIYDDSITTEDIQSVNTNNLKTYCYNDTLGRLKNIAYDQIYKIMQENSISKIEDETENEDYELTKLHSRLREIKYISPLSEFLTFPILSRITEIPYDHFKTISAEHSAVLSIYVQNLLTKVFENQFTNMISLLSYYPVDQPILVTTYLLKKLNDNDGFINVQNSLGKFKNFFGFDTITLCNKILSSFVGKIPKSNFIHTITGKVRTNIPTSKIEVEVIKFFTYLFSGQMEPEIKKMKRLLNEDF